MFRSLAFRAVLALFAVSLYVAPSAWAQDAAPEPATLSLGEGSLELTATWERLTDTVYNFEQNYPLVAELKPVAQRARYDAAQFRPFLPEQSVAVGDLWRIDVEHALPFLRQFHPGATAALHHDGGFGLGAHGGWACLRALNARFAELRLRVHADFMIDGDGSRGGSSWFTPAQFAGRMLIDRIDRKVVAFELGVPSQSANVDVNIAAKGNIVADIGRIPRMDLVGGQFPAQAFGPQARSIPVREAELLLARSFYPLAEIDWMDLAAGRAESKASGKPLHVIALFGSLMDESC